MATVGQPINWTSELANLGLGAMTGGVGYAMSNVSNYVNGLIGQYFDKKSEKRAFQRQLQLMESQYQYARRYAENAPSWNVLGLRNAGLNPILAVSNGANLGSTVPSSPSTASHSSIPSSSYAGLRYDPLTRSQLLVNEATIRNLDAQAEAATLNSISQAKEREANTTLRVLEAEQRKKANFSSPIVRDAETVVRRLVDTVKDYSKLWSEVETDIHSSFINNSPSRLRTKPIHDRTSDARSNAYDNAVNSEWKTRRVFDGKPVYRKRGDVGGVMHMYR